MHSEKEIEQHFENIETLIGDYQLTQNLPDDLIIHLLSRLSADYALAIYVDEELQEAAEVMEEGDLEEADTLSDFLPPSPSGWN